MYVPVAENKLGLFEYIRYPRPIDEGVRPWGPFLERPDN